MSGLVWAGPTPSVGHCRPLTSLLPRVQYANFCATLFMANMEVHGTEIPTEVLDHQALAVPLKHYA